MVLLSHFYQIATIELPGQLACQFPVVCDKQQRAIFFPAATGITFQLQSSADLVFWQDETAIEVAPNVYRTTTAISPGARQYLRLAISQQ